MYYQVFKYEKQKREPARHHAAMFMWLLQGNNNLGTGYKIWFM